MSAAQLRSLSISSIAPPAPAFLNIPDFASDLDDEEDNLPYPTELPRSDFLKPDFDPQEYLSSLRDRHQALEDLRSDLRGRSQLLNQELLDLVNGNYEEFLSLGADLNGGEDKVEGVRVGLLGFTREIETLKASVVEREAEFSTLLSEGKQIRQEIVFGRKLLEIEASVETLEDILGVTGEGLEDADLLDDAEEEEELDDSQKIVRKLNRTVEHYANIQEQINAVGISQPFVAELKPRLDEIRRTLLLDLSSALRQAKSTKDPKMILELSRMFSDINAKHEALQILKAK